MLKSLLCDESSQFLVVEDADTISDIVAHKDRRLWLDVEEPTAEELELVRQEFNLHPLAIEDATKRHQRPKVDQYDNFYFVVFYAVSITEPDGGDPAGRSGLRGTRFHEQGDNGADAEPADGAVGELVTEHILVREIAMFFGKNYLITVHQDPIPEFDEVARRWFRNAHEIAGALGMNHRPQGTRELTPDEEAALEHSAEPGNAHEKSPTLQPMDSGRLMSLKRPGSRDNMHVRQPPDQVDENAGQQSHTPNDIGVLLYSLLDTLVDSYFPLVDHVVDRVEDLEEQIFERFNQNALQSVFTLKKDLLMMRKVLAPERDVLNILTRRDLPIFEEHTIVYFQDVYDHVVRITDSIDTYRDLLSSALDSFLSVQSNRLNVTVQTLTSVSIILMSIAAFTGWYGMNFQYMPELHTTWGYPLLIVVVAVIVITEVAFFKRRGWL
jgi:Mg2+ and Co2+ transporter CorA